MLLWCDDDEFDNQWTQKRYLRKAENTFPDTCMIKLGICWTGILQWVSRHIVHIHKKFSFIHFFCQWVICFGTSLKHIIRLTIVNINIWLIVNTKESSFQNNNLNNPNFYKWTFRQINVRTIVPFFRMLNIKILLYFQIQDHRSCINIDKSVSSTSQSTARCS